MSAVHEFNLYNRLHEIVFESYNDKLKHNIITKEYISTLRREQRYIRRCMLKIIRQNPNLKLKATEYLFHTDGSYLRC